MINTVQVFDLRNKYDEIEKALDKADFEAKSSTKRLSRKEVFTKIRSKINT